MTKFTVRRDPVSGMYVTLSNNIEDERVTAPPVCGALAAVTLGVTSPQPCCSMEQQLLCADPPPACVWCHAVSRNNLTLAGEERQTLISDTYQPKLLPFVVVDEIAWY